MYSPSQHFLLGFICLCPSELQKQKWSESCSVVSNSLQPHEWYSPWNSPGQNTGVGSHSLLQEIFPTQGSNSGLPHCSWILHQLSHQGNRNHFNYSIYSTQNLMLYTGLRRGGCESWTVKKAERWRIDAFELWCWRTLLKVPWTARRSNQSILKETSPEYSLIGTDAEVPILWPPDVKNWLIRKDPDAGEDWRQEEKGTTEDEMAGWHHWLNEHEFEQALGVGDGQGKLVCCSSWGCRVGHDNVTALNRWRN